VTTGHAGGRHEPFSVDYPLEDGNEAARFIEAAPLSEAERQAVCFRNAVRVLRL
jgi:2,3-dihydroxybenzoate decarboxylase